MAHRTLTYLFRATVFIKVEGTTKGGARPAAEAIRDEIKRTLPTGATLGDRLS